MSVHQAGESALRQPTGPLAASESAALGLSSEVDDYDNADSDLNSLAPPPPAYEPPTRSVYESTVEKNRRADEVEPGLTHFRGQRSLHVSQLRDLEKRERMVTERIDKMNEDVEKLRQQWGELERAKTALLVSHEGYEKKLGAQRRIVHKDDVTAKKYHDYLTLAEEVLALDDSDDEDDDNDFMHDWEAQEHDGGENEGHGEDEGEEQEQ